MLEIRLEKKRQAKRNRLPKTCLDNLALEFGQFCFQHAQMERRRLVLLRLGHLGLDLGNLLNGRHGCDCVGGRSAM